MGSRWWRKKYDQELILSKHRDPGPFPYVVVIDHLKASFNVPKIIRSANALGAREVHLVGVPAFDPTPARGTLRQTRTRSFATFGECHAALRQEGYAIYALAADGEAVLGREELPEKCAFVAGHEEFGLSFDPTRFDGVRKLRIPQFGDVNSLNVSIAASLACYEWVRRHRG